MRAKVNTLTLSQVFLPSQALLRDAVLVLGFSLFTTLAAYIALPVPFSPVPITAQTLAVLLAGAILGSKRGALSQMLYLGQGLVGLPVFAGGASGIAYAMGPTGGYLIGFVLAAYLVGTLAELKWDRHPVTMVLAMVAGSAVIYGLGASWLAIILHVDISRALALGVVPYLVGDVVKIALAAATLPSAWHLLRRFGNVS